LTIYVTFVKLATDNRAAVGDNYKELYDCKWDLMTLTNNTLHRAVFKFL